MVVIVSRAPNAPLGSLDPALLELPLSVLNLTVRATHCLADIPTVGALLECPEAELMRLRNFGRVSLGDVRRKLVGYIAEQTGCPDSDRIREALCDPHPALQAVWRAPVQARPLAAVVAELLELLSRPGELYRAAPWRSSPHRIGPPRAPDLEAATLEEVVESLFADLKERERRVLERRFGPLEGGPATLAEVGREFGLTRERVRQIVRACLDRLSEEGERRRRAPFLACLREAFVAAGGVLRERDLAARLLRRFPPPHPDLGPVLRVFLTIEAEYHPAGRGLWVLAGVGPERVRALQDAFHARLCAAGRPLPERVLLAELLDHDRDLTPTLLAGCLAADDRLLRRDDGCWGLAKTGGAWHPASGAR